MFTLFCDAATSHLLDQPIPRKLEDKTAVQLKIYESYDWSPLPKYKYATKKSSSPYPNHLPQPKQTEKRCQSCKIIDESVHQVQPCASLALSQVISLHTPTLQQKDHLQLNPKGTAGMPRNMNISPHSFVSPATVTLVVETEFVARLFHRSRIQWSILADWEYCMRW